MDFGIVDLISVLMGISGFSVGTNPNAPTPAAALEYVQPDADLILYADVGAVVPGNYKVLTNLANQPQIKASPELAKAVRKLVAQVDGPRGLFKQLTGVDLATDVSDATISCKFIPKQDDPTCIMSVHGKFTTGNLEKLAKTGDMKTVKVGGGLMWDAGDGNSLSVTKSNVVVAGATDLVKERLADTYKAPQLTAGSTLGNAADVLGGKPVFAIFVSLSQAIRTEAIKEAGGKQNFIVDLIKRHKLWSFAVYKDGIGWTWVDSQKGGIDSMAQVSEGMVDILRAAQIAPRGFAKIMLGALDSYKGVDKHVDELIKHKGDLVKIMEAYTGDGQFKSQIDKDAKNNKLSVRLTGKSLTEVLPFGGLVPLGAAAWFAFLGEKEATPSVEMATPPPPPPPPPPAKKGAATPPKGGAPKRP